MTRDAGLATINCTSCGAGLDVLGGGRVVAHICGYCGAELDAQDNYKVLARFDGLKRPQSPFRIGMTGTLSGVDYTVIGTLEYRENWGGRSWTWVDHQLFSPTHGYAWITVEEGHLIFTRRYRRPVWMSEYQVERAENRPYRSVDGQIYSYFDTSTAAIIFAEGEFTWAPKIGDQSSTVNALGRDAMLSFSETGDEREVYRSSYLDRAEVEAGFGISTGLKGKGTHALQVFTAGPEFKFIRNAALAFALVSLMIAGWLEARGGDEVLPRQVFAAQTLPQTLRFDLSDTTGLTRIRIGGDAMNSWAYIGVELDDPEGEPLFEAGRTIEFYTGRDNDGVWREGSNRGDIYFRPEVPGSYALTLTVEDQGLWDVRNANPPLTRPAVGQISVSLQEGLSSGFWMMLLAAGFALAALYQYGRRYWHYSRRWSGSDWSDED
jgi:Domain of unknown function (DUF4178)